MGLTASGSLLDPGKLTERMFEQMDDNMDGQLSKEEFMAGAMRDATIVELLTCQPGTVTDGQ